MASGEVVIQSMWSPAITAVRSKGVPCVHHPLKEGDRSRGGGIGLSKNLSGIEPDAAYEYVDWRLSGWVGGFLMRQGYRSAVPETSKNFMTEDEWGFWTQGPFSFEPAFDLENHDVLLTSPVTVSVYLKTLAYVALTWAFTLGIGFTVASFLAFHLRSLTWRIALFLLCAIPFWTSNIIRMISWTPFLGRNGIANSTLLELGLIDAPLEWLLSSGFGSQLTWTPPFGLPIMFAVFDRFDKSCEEAARDLGAAPWRTVRHVVPPIIAPALIGVALFGFTLRYDEFARTLPTAGSYNTLPLEIFGMTTNVTTPVLYAPGTLTTMFSMAVILCAPPIFQLARSWRRV